MNKLKMKAKAGVTLIELLVVVLIVVVLSVSLLPLLQPFVTESQYAAEAIPVIGNLRTKIGLYQYDKGKLPYNTKATETNQFVHTWTVDSSDGEKYIMQGYAISADGTAQIGSGVLANNAGAEHLGMLIDVDYEDLKGKRSKPLHYQYYAISSEKNQAYVLACFGDGNGLKAGTGYAVCELNFTSANKKYIGTWKRYKPTKDDAGALQFGTDAPLTADTKLDYCFVPAASGWDSAVTGADDPGEPPIITSMKKAGWEF